MPLLVVPVVVVAVVLFFVKIDVLSCTFESRNEEVLLEEINRERTQLALKNFQVHLTLQLAAQKRCTDREHLLEAHQRMISNIYRDDDWPRQEQLNQIFPRGKHRLGLESIIFSRLC